MDELQFYDGDIYVIDTSGLIQLEYVFKPNNPVFSAIWEEIDDMIAKRQFLTLDFVELEINDYKGKKDFIKNWLDKHKNTFIVKTNAEIINAAIPIINEEYYTGFLN